MSEITDHVQDPFTPVRFLEGLQREIGDGSLISLHRIMLEKYGMPECGTSRATYSANTVVFKVPLNPDGFFHNDAEYSLISTGCIEEDQLAKTKIHAIEDIPVLAMEKVIPASFGDIKARIGHVPDWVYAVDMAQVGFSKSGQLKAYDYAELMGKRMDYGYG